jgi:LysM repeat protein
MVQPGDTLFRIAQRYGTTVEAIIYANSLTSDVIQAGQVLNITGSESGGYTEPNFGQAPSQPYGNAPYQQPPFVPGVGGNFHMVAPGETLFGIASRYRAPLEVIAEANRLVYPYTLGIGQQLIIPAPAPYPNNNFGSTPNNSPDQAPFMPGAPMHLVAPGETLFAIASRYGAPLEAIAEANGLAYPYTLSIGQQLIIPAPAPYPGDSFGEGNFMPPADNPTVAPGNGYIHNVAPGENLFGIASQYRTTVEAIARANSIPYPYVINIGQQLAIPAPEAYPGPQIPPTGGGYYQQPYPAQPPVEGSMPAPGNMYGPSPGNTGTHTVAPGETLFSIATIYGTDAEALAAANGLSNPNQLFVGQVLYLP